MPIQSGTHLGPYEILSAIGAGGMGEVYRARDPKLGRDVAIKVLPEAFARDAERMARFQREAKVLASLNHPNIATIHGLEDSGDTHALVMELVEGPTLADRIKAGAIPVDEAVRIARQIADALEYAHERGIIHRDLKPANVKVTNDDIVKVLDFGLAKALEGDPSSIDISTSPTISRMATQQGVLLGTAAYMSPEQAKAKSVDRRADIWAFGCVFYEMLTGKQAFTGETVTDTLASIIKEDPDWKLLPSATPMRVRVLLQRCLQKDPKQRLRDIGDARISLDEILSGAPEAATGVAAAPPAWRRALPWTAALAAVAAASLATWILKPASRPASPEPMRFQIPVPPKTTLGLAGTFALSPDGRQLVFAASGSDGVTRIWIRALDSFEAHPLPGTEGAEDVSLPLLWSPDSRFIAFYGNGQLKKVPATGGPPETICDISHGVMVGGSWNRDGVIVFGQSAGGGLMRVPASGGPASPLTEPDPLRGEDAHVMPWFLPDGRHFLYLRTSRMSENEGLYIGSLDAKPAEQSLKPLMQTHYASIYIPSADPDSGHLLFVRNGTLLAQPFDARQMKLSGDPMALAEGLGTFLNVGFFSASNNGVLAYRASGAGSYQLTWYDRTGKELGTAGDPADLFVNVGLSPDGTHAAVSRTGGQEQFGIVWLLDLMRGVSERFTFGSASALAPVWSPDGSRVIFASNPAGNYDLYQKAASGATGAQLVLKSPDDKIPDSWSRDGRFLLYTAADPKTKGDLWVLPLGAEKRPFPYLRTEFNESNGQFSPDGHWVAYESDESGRFEIYVRPFSSESNGIASSAGGKWLISNGGGTNPHWRGDGRELYYTAPNADLMAVEVSANPTFQAGVPKVLFQAPQLVVGAGYSQWNVTADGKRFLIAAPAVRFAQAPFDIVLNWQALLNK